MNGPQPVQGLRGDLRLDEPMAEHTSWRVGGAAEQYYCPADADDLAAYLAGLPADMPVYWVGLGSNLLVRDGGLRGAVISTRSALRGIERLDETNLRVEAGVACSVLARSCARWGLGPAQFFAGIPGTVGGALAMNAGAFGGETWEHVCAVDTIARNGARSRRTRDRYRVGYRSVEGPQQEWFLAAYMRFEKDPEAGRDSIRGLLAQRNASQPIGLASCGSVFRNPEGDHAARLIEACGLKAARRGAAQVSEKHANFIINTGGASAKDIEDLMLHVQATVQERFGVRLVPEVQIVGEAQ